MRRATAGLRRGGLLALLCLLAGPAFAHTKSETHTVWQIVGRTVHLTFTMPIIEANRLAVNGVIPPPNARVSEYLTAHLAVTSKGGRCPPSGPAQAQAATDQFRRFEMTFQCPSTEGLVLHSSAFFALVPSHVTFAQIETDKGDFIEQLFSRDAQDVAASASAGGELASASFFRYVQLGIMHIFTGVDHMSFLLGLVLISRRVRDLAFVVTGFTLGHSATLALAVTGIIRPHAEFIDALVALTIAVIGAENIAVATHRPGVVALGLGGLLLAMAAARLQGIGLLPATLLLGAAMFCCCYLLISGQLRDSGRLRLVVTLVFGLIHGFGFASDLLEMRLPAGRLAELLVGFNLGVEVGQLTLVLVALAAVRLLMKVRLALPRPIVVETLSAALVGLGMFWFISRSFA
ncbi:MAG TPA: HupE/UreJ family protein [Steroidobacteraceae bacterium]|nr:HupE/UreJ family protein [Steroidobacteraceae bacterium]